MTSTSSNLNELIEVLNDGVSFYEDAANATESERYTSLFRRMASTKRAICADLKAEVAYEGDTPSDSGTVAGAMRKTYTELRATLSKRPDQKYIDQLEASEDRILAAFRDALTSSENAKVRNIAQNYLPDISRMHAEMRDLKQQLKAA